MIRNLCIFLSLVLLVACATKPAHVVKAYESGTEGITVKYLVDEAEAWRGVRAVLEANAATEVYENGECGYVTAVIGREPMSTQMWKGALLSPFAANDGSTVGVWVMPLGLDATEVAVVARRNQWGQITYGITEEQFHAQLKAVLTR